ncbi:hypothetical protein K0M31_015242 [Melipona bicolor]|uniref:Uncharacterized protein n=1 Tax=Melipona bicolor TaxID=60889 RepID=A0AA40FGS8_9HYME|nr:hypothetical protein K0M31_015242 [Melipona bicolor]
MFMRGITSAWNLVLRDRYCSIYVDIAFSEPRCDCHPPLPNDPLVNSPLFRARGWTAAGFEEVPRRIPLKLTERGQERLKSIELNIDSLLCSCLRSTFHGLRGVAREKEENSLGLGFRFGEGTGSTQIRWKVSTGHDSVKTTGSGRQFSSVANELGLGSRQRNAKNSRGRRVRPQSLCNEDNKDFLHAYEVHAAGSLALGLHTGCQKTLSISPLPINSFFSTNSIDRQYLSSMILWFQRRNYDT